MMRWCAGVLAALLAASAAAAQEQAALEALRGPVDEVLGILRDPQYRPPEKKAAQRERLWPIIRRVFDFDAISERAVGRNWKRFSPPQQRAFSDAFSELLGENYLAKIQSGYTNEKVEYLGQELPAPGKARVKTRIVREVDAIPVEYSLYQGGGGWRIYDVMVEGVSLVQNYRTQFDQILSRDSPDVLIERIVAKNRTQQQH